MRLESIELENYRRFKRFSVKLEPAFNVIVGVNGSGKTSLLKGIRDVLQGLTAFVQGVSNQPLILGDVDLVRVETQAFGDRHRFEKQYPVSVGGAALAFGQPCEWRFTLPGYGSTVEFKGRTPGAVLSDVRRTPQVGVTSDAFDTFPLLAFYPAYRQWRAVSPSEFAAATQKEERTDGYDRWTDAAADPQAFQRWTVAKSLERMQLATDRGIPIHAIHDDELALVNRALEAVVEGIKGLRYDFSQKAIVIDWSDGRPITLYETLSDGQRVSIALVADIARRMCLLNPHFGSEVTQKTPGVVLIDELDIHLHPHWQRRVANGLRAAFPAVQFIATTHSPQILGELKPEEIIVLSDDEALHPQISYGLDASRILNQIMNAGGRAKPVEAALSALYEAIERNRFDEARELLVRLQELAPGIPELSGAAALLRRKEVLGK